jgi:hypothetical protein
MIVNSALTPSNRYSSVEDNMHVAINLKDFKAVVAHAETANATVTARYTLVLLFGCQLARPGDSMENTTYPCHR